MGWRAEFLNGPLEGQTYESGVGALPGDGRLVMHHHGKHVIRLDPALIDIAAMPPDEVARYELVERIEVGLYRLVADE